jgi:hypothetical protein
MIARHGLISGARRRPCVTKWHHEVIGAEPRFADHAADRFGLPQAPGAIDRIVHRQLQFRCTAK